VASRTSTRLWRTCKAAGRPFPQLVEDDVLDYLITEAVAIKVNREDAAAREEAEKKAEMDQAKKDAIEELKRLYPAKGR
jgi:hypothetical protein